MSNISFSDNSYPATNLNEAQAILELVRSWALSIQDASALTEREIFGVSLALETACERIGQAQEVLSAQNDECRDRKERIREILHQATNPEAQAG